MTDVVVVGGGASGVLAAVALAAEDRIDSVTVLERSERVGPGLAYGAADAHHLLNSPAGRMSAIQERPDDFVAWCAAGGDPVEPSAFVPRRRYGDYLASVLADLVTTSAGRVRTVRAEAVAVEPRPVGVVVRLADGAGLEADHAVLALGNPPPVGRGIGGDAQHVRDPWAPGALDAIDGGSVLLLGTGLTAIDVATRLARRDPAVRLTATSRHLLLPRVHLPAPAAPGPGLRPSDASLSAVLAAFRDRLRAAERPWQAEADGVRPQVNALWAGFGAADRTRFVRHVSRRWEVHRHRMPASVAAELDALRADGRLELTRTPRPAAFDAVVDCTGSRPTVSGGWNPLVDRLLADGEARADALGIGLDTTEEGALRDATGRPSAVLHVLGPARRGSQWESTAVPEIRQQAGVLAAGIASA